VFLDELAKEWGLIKVIANQPLAPESAPKPGPIRVELPKPAQTARTIAGKDACAT
jgi:hypothetical protein